ncbi:MAG: 3-isopropylmalate dehydratase small subunit [Opitutales bacterium]
MPLEKITQVTGRGVPLPGDDIDTDRIIPARFMKVLTFDELGPLAFYDERFGENGKERTHVLNEELYREATILVTGSNFGCGSSREHAPQSLYRYGFRAVIAESFAEIFFGNSTTLGMPCVVITAEDRRALNDAIVADPSLALTVDLEQMQVRAGELSMSCMLPDSARQSLTEGSWDPLAELLEGAPEVDRVFAQLAYTR